MKNPWFILITILFLLVSTMQYSTAQQKPYSLKVSGIVYHDNNLNGTFEPSKDTPLRGIAVSNGREVVTTNRKGRYELPLRDNSAVFVIKPRNWMVPVDETQIPRFYYMHSPQGAGGNVFEGLAPTGAIPKDVNFPLYASSEPDKFDVLVFGDTQPRDDKEIYYTANDVIPELIGTDAAFGITLGDVVFDDLNLFNHIAGAVSTIGIPWRNVPGNHDNDYSGNTQADARGAWYRTFGPAYYSFTYGPAHFVVLDNIRWIVDGDKRYYRTGLGEDQMEFLRNEIKRISDDQLLVLLAHIPFTGSTAWQLEAEQKAFFELLAEHPKSLSLVAHTHRHYHDFIGADKGYLAANPHHMVSVGTVCGAWWSGAPDEFGVPHTTMSDGTPTSYAFLQIDGNNWKLKWKAARRPADFQMYIDAPDFISTGDSLKVTANIYNALPSADVKMRIGGQGEWTSMKQTPQNDPAREATLQRENLIEGNVPWRKMGRSAVSKHIWETQTLNSFSPGVYLIEVKAEDDWWEYEGRRLLHVR